VEEGQAFLESMETAASRAEHPSEKLQGMSSRGMLMKRAGPEAWYGCLTGSLHDGGAK